MLEAIFDSSVSVTQYLQSIDRLISPMEFFTFLGTEDFYSLVMPVLIWSIDYGLGMRVGVVLLTGNSLNAMLKWAFHLPRPFWYDGQVTGLAPETSFGLPSGHSQNPASIYGLIAASLKRGWAWAAALVLIFLIGLSRVVLGVHFTLDVLGGWTIGFLFLWAFLRLEAPVRSWFDKQTLSRQVGSAFGLSLVIIIIAMAVLAATGSFEMPAVWEANAGIELDPFSLEGLLSSTGSLFGLAAGGFWLASQGGFDAGGALWKRVMRFLVGVIGVLAILQGLDMVFPDSQDLIGYSFRYLRYGLMGFWVSGLAPVVFKRVGLAE